MIFPLQDLIEFNGNVYEITCASTKRASQLAALQSSYDDGSTSKVVPEAAKQIFTGDVEYKIEYKSEASV